MDHFVDSTRCGDARNLAYADSSTVQPYWDLAASGALADRWFQPTLGQSASNDMFLFGASFIFLDNTVEPAAPGAECSIETIKPFSFDTTNTIGDLLQANHISWTWYAEGWASMLDAELVPRCPDAPLDCQIGWSLYPCVFEPDDIPATYYPQFVDDPMSLRDYSSFKADLDRRTLPQVAFIKGLGYHTEHPGLETNITDGIHFVQTIVDQIDHSDYAPDTLVLIVYDEGGGYFDHVAPAAAVDEHPYGTRVPVIAVGPRARGRTNTHVTLEHSSIVNFIEWNWQRQTGQLGARDTVVANIGSLTDPALGVPEGN